MRPHADDLHRLDVIQDLVNEPVLHTDASGKGPGNVADQFLVAGRALAGILSQNVEEPFRLGF